MKYDYILFDLDGTLTESELGITNSAAIALKELGYPVPNDMRFFIGPPLFWAFRECGMTEAEANNAIAIYRRNYEARGWREMDVYPGIPALLKSLKLNGAYLAIASAKPEPYVKRIAEHFGFGKYFDRIIGSNAEAHDTSKTAIIEAALPAGIDRSRACVVGDRQYDIEAAAEAGACSVGADYGYCEPGELRLAGATHIARNVPELTDILLGDSPRAPGVFITLEGGDGCGKSTQLRLLNDWLIVRGYETLITREPGGCPISERIRELVLDVGAAGMTPECEALLYAAARAQHVHDVIAPAIEAGKVVISDRFLDSSIAYQAYGRELGEQMIRQINAPAVKGVMPELTLLLLADMNRAKHRLTTAHTLDRIEREGDDFVGRTNLGYETLMRNEPERVKPIDGNLTVDEVFSAIERELKRVF